MYKKVTSFDDVGPVQRFADANMEVVSSGDAGLVLVLGGSGRGLEAPCQFRVMYEEVAFTKPPCHQRRIFRIVSSGRSGRSHRGPLGPGRNQGWCSEHPPIPTSPLLSNHTDQTLSRDRYDWHGCHGADLLIGVIRAAFVFTIFVCG